MVGVIDMVTTIKEFGSLSDFIKSLDETIASYRKLVGELLRKLEELRIRAEQEKQVRALLTRLGLSETPRVNEVDVKGVKLIYNPSLSQELTSIETIVESINSKIATLSSIRKEFEAFSGVDLKMKVVAIYIDDIPKTVLLRSD